MYGTGSRSHSCARESKRQNLAHDQKSYPELGGHILTSGFDRASDIDL
jgi:hypothetical protein